MGFIAPSAGGEDHFVHRSFLQDGNCLVVGSVVEFEASWDAMKQKNTARNVTGALTMATGVAPAALPRPQGQIVMPMGKGAKSPQARVIQPQAVRPQLVQPYQPQYHSGAKGGAQGGFQSGTVKSWKEERGMGFISPHDGSQDHFVHRSQLTDGNSLQEGAEVSFQADWDPQKNKPVAKNVTGAIQV